MYTFVNCLKNIRMNDNMKVYILKKRGAIIMIITFCGHSKFLPNRGDEERFLSLLEKICDGEFVEFWLGGYGGFDNFAWHCCRMFQKSHSNSRLVFITPYLLMERDKNDSLPIWKNYDEIIYPGLEKVPKRYAISHRNRWMVEGADAIICYIQHSYGGAYATYRHALAMKKTIYHFDTKKDSA